MQPALTAESVKKSESPKGPADSSARALGGSVRPDELRVGDLVLDPVNRRVAVGGVSVELTSREFDLLLVLARQAGRVIEGGEIYAKVWGGVPRLGDRSVSVHVRKLRTKLEAAAPGWHFVHTRYGVGYRLAPEEIA